jgi:HD-like signal output (HDOD) protein
MASAINMQPAVAQRIESLPSLSDVVREFLEISRREDVTPKELERVVAKDQALVARLLKLANSSFFSPSRSVATISDAVVLIGLDAMKKMVYAVASEGLMRRELHSYPYPDRGFWVHGQAVGMASRALAEASSAVSLRGEEAFVAGLLHDVGQLILDDLVDRSPGKRVITLAEETAACGLDHAALGELIARRWNIAEPIAVAVRHHHDVDAAGDHRSGAACVALAEIISTAWAIGLQSWMDLGEEIDVQQHADLLEMLGLAPAALPEVLWELRRKLAALDRLFDGD